MFSYHFMQRALIVGVLVSLCAALLGVSLVLKRYSMIGDGLSHVGFGALAVAASLSIAPMIVAIPTVIVAAVLLLRISKATGMKGDSAIAMISSSALAVGVVSMSLSGGMNTEVNSYMFGSILSLSRSDAILSILLSLVVLVVFIAFYPRLFAVTFDETFSKATGVKTDLFNTLLAVLTAVTVVLGMRMMGTLLISSLIIFPALSAMRVCKSFRSVVVVSAVISVLCFSLGLISSYILETPTGASIVLADLAAYIIFSLLGKLKTNK